MDDHGCEMVSPEEFLIQNGTHLLYSDDISLLNVKNEVYVFCLALMYQQE